MPAQLLPAWLRRQIAALARQASAAAPLVRCEPLEPRQLLSFTTNVNFQPANTPLHPGYAADTGTVFGSRGNGLSYGWDVDNAANMRDRDSAASPDQRYDTLGGMGWNTTGGQRWELAVPNGTYQVRTVVGDATSTGQTHRLTVEGTPLADAVASKEVHWHERVSVVAVADGRLTLSLTATNAGAALNFVDVVDAGQVTAAAAPTALRARAGSPTLVNLDWADPNAQEAEYRVERKTGAGGTWAQVGVVPVNQTWFNDTGLAAGTTYYYRARAYNAAGLSAYAAEAAVTTPATNAQGPYGGTPWPIGGTVQAEDFDLGPGEWAFSDTDGNLGGAYRQAGPDISVTRDGGTPGYRLGWTRSGEWDEYTVNVAAAGTYQLDLRLGSAGPGGTIHVEFDGVDKTYAVEIPNTGSVDAFQTVTRQVSLAAGVQVMRLYVDAVAAGQASAGELNWFRFTPSTVATPAAPSNVTAVATGDATATVTWTDNASAENGYRVYRSTDPTFAQGVIVRGPAPAVAGTGGTGTFLDTGLLASTTYYYQVRAAVDALVSAPATAAAGVTTATAAAPSPLGGLAIGTAAAAGGTGWTRDKAFDGDARTFFESSVATGGWTGLDFGGPRSVTKLRYAGRANYAARMVGGKFQASNDAAFATGVVDLYAVPSAPSGTVAVDLPAASAPARYVRYLGPADGRCNVAEVEFWGVAPPKGPTGLAAGAATGSSVPLTWADNANNEAGYAVDRATDAAFTQNVVTDATLAANATGHTATGLTAGTTYYFRVRAINAAGSSVPSNVVSVTPVAAATDLVETLLVPSDGQTVSTAAVLASGTQYWLRAIGYVYIGGQYGDRAADADWIRWPDPTYTTDVHPTGDDLGVRVVGSSLKWGPYSAEHVYTQTYAGTGSPLGAFFKDLPDSYADNLPGHIAVQVWRQPPPAYAPAVFVTATDPAAAEVPAGQPQNPGRFTLTRVGTPSVPLTVNYTVAGTASPGADYAALSGSVTFAAWATTATVDVTVTDDTTAEAAETVVLTVVQPAGHAPAGPTSATVTIADNDGGTTPPPVPLVTISPATATVNEAGQTSATFTVTRNVVTSEALAVTFAVDPAAIDPAEAGDYAVLPTGTTITILAGQPSATITLTAQQDADADDERLVLRLVDAAAYDLGTPFQAAVTINDSGGTSPGGPSVDLDLFEDTNGDGVHDNGAAAEAAEASQPTALPREGDDVDMAELALVVSGAAADATVSFGYATSELRLYRDLMALNPVTPGQVISLADLGISGSGTVAVFAAHTGGGTTTVVAAAGIAVTMGGTSPATSTALAGGTTAAPPPSPGDPALQDDVPDNYGGLDDGDGTQPLTDRDGFWDPGKNFGARTLRASNKTPPSAAATSRSSRTAA